MGPGRIAGQPAQASLFGMFLQKVGLGSVQRWLAALSRNFYKKIALLVSQAFGGWPPRPDFFRKRGYYIVAFLFGPLVIEGLYSYFFKPERQKSSYIERETKKRMRTLCEIIKDEKLQMHFPLFLCSAPFRPSARGAAVCSQPQAQVFRCYSVSDQGRG